MLIVGDHTTHEKDFKYSTYDKSDNAKSKKHYTTYNKRNLLRVNSNKILNINYSIWLKSLNKTRIEYLKQIGIKDLNKLQSLSRLSFNILPYDIRSKLQTCEVKN